jgi:4-diphosphocytidyl-2-C-methyl-D-erythritol kinase
MDLILPAFAKVNLGLRVIGRRADGYHEIDTVFQTISLHDTIILSRTDDSRLIFSCDDRALPVDETNLVVRAARALQKNYAPQKGARLQLIKRIPSQAGLGGGSADAGATLIGLMRLWQVELEATVLRTIAAELGADVPFFLGGGTARGTGTGHHLRELADVAERFLLIIKPNDNISTAEAYAALKCGSLTSVPAKTILASSQSGEFFDISDSEALRNDFEPVVFALSPEIARAQAALLRAEACAAVLAGSGSAVFGVFDSGDAQKRAIQAIELETGWRVFPCKTVGRESYRAAMDARVRSS